MICNAIMGAPDAVFEVLSASTVKKDHGKKMKMYRKCGVAEYFLADPDNQIVEKYVFSEGRPDSAETYEGDEVFSIDTIGLDLVAGDLFG